MQLNYYKDLLNKTDEQDKKLVESINEKKKKLMNLKKRFRTEQKPELIVKIGKNINVINLLKYSFLEKISQ